MAKDECMTQNLSRGRFKDRVSRGNGPEVMKGRCRKEKAGVKDDSKISGSGNKMKSMCS